MEQPPAPRVNPNNETWSRAAQARVATLSSREEEKRKKASKKAAKEAESHHLYDALRDKIPRRVSAGLMSGESAEVREIWENAGDVAQPRKKPMKRISAILAFSSTDVTEDFAEWFLMGTFTNQPGDDELRIPECICGSMIKQGCILGNIATQNQIVLGRDCVKGMKCAQLLKLLKEGHALTPKLIRNIRSIPTGNDPVEIISELRHKIMFACRACNAAFLPNLKTTEYCSTCFPIIKWKQGYDLVVKQLKAHATEKNHSRGQVEKRIAAIAMEIRKRIMVERENEMRQIIERQKAAKITKIRESGERQRSHEASLVKLNCARCQRQFNVEPKYSWQKVCFQCYRIRQIGLAWVNHK